MYKRQDCESLTSIDVSNWDTSSVETLSLIHISLDTSQVRIMDRVFYDKNYLRTIDISGWDTSQVTSMSYTFAVDGESPDRSSLEEIIGIESLDVSKVVDIDVYKRQSPQAAPVQWAGQALPPGKAPAGAGRCLHPVSYTHLDVYKRPPSYSTQPST